MLLMIKYKICVIEISHILIGRCYGTAIIPIKYTICVIDKRSTKVGDSGYNRHQLTILLL